MDCIILAAGFATRLHPLTKEIPKALLAVGDKPIIEYIIDKINEIPDMGNIYVVSNNKFVANFEVWKENFNSKIPIQIINDGTNSNEDRLGALGDIKFVLTLKKINKEILVIAGDNLFDFSLLAFMEFYKLKNSSVVALYDLKDKNKIRNKFGCVQINQENKVINFEEKPNVPKSTLASTGCYLFAGSDLKELINFLDEYSGVDEPGKFLSYLFNKKPIYGYVFQEDWLDIGSFDQLEEAYAKYDEL